MSLKTDGFIFIFSSPSGAGKTTLVELVSQKKNFITSISHTTRAPRDGEEHGIDYFFVSEKEFKKNIEKGEYIEHATVHGNYYGTPKSQIDNDLNKDLKILLEIDWQGALQIMDHYPEAESIFI